MTDRQPELPGQKPGDRRVRVERRHAPVLQVHGPRRADRPGGSEHARRRNGRRLVAAPSRSSSADRWPATRRARSVLSKKKALAIFSSDAISSSAYATEEILRVLVVAGTAALF